MESTQSIVCEIMGFPGGSVVKNLPANSGNTGLIPDLGRSHVSRSTEAHEPQLLSQCSRAWELQLQKPSCPRALGFRVP